MLEALFRNENTTKDVEAVFYIGDVMGAGGRCDDALRTIVRCALGKFREILPLFAIRSTPLQFNGKICVSYMQL